MIDRATIDFETRSACSIKNCGSWRYSLDPTTEILCLAFRLPYWDEGRTGLWHPAFPQFGILEAEAGGDTIWEDLAELYAWIMAGGIVEAHSAFFERGIWVNICERMGWPLIHPHQWRCSAAKAASHALPRALEDAVTALRLPIDKDDEGHKLMLKMCKPRKPKKSDWITWNREHAPCRSCSGTGKVDAFKKDGSPAAKQKKCGVCAGTGARNTDKVPPMPLLYHENREDLFRLFEYCRTDVLAEEGLSHRLDDLVPDETNLYMIDQVINERGFCLDNDAITAALELVDEECVELNAELCALTGGVVERATQRDRMIAWFETQGLRLQDTQKDTIEELLERVDSPENPPWVYVPTGAVRRALELMKMLGRSSTAKFIAMRDWICPDDRAHGSLLYHGASTGRWTGKGVQPHNFVRGEIADMDAAWDALKSKDRARIAAITNKDGDPIGSVMDVLAHALRGAIIASPGKELFVSDFSGIEARVLLWVAGDEDGLDIFREGRDIYCEMASDIYQRPISKKTDPEERQLGKATILGCFGADTLVLTDRGWTPITNVSSGDLVWDGVSWVRHDGVVPQGLQETQTWLGVSVTPDHKIWTGDQWVLVSSVALNASIQSRVLATGMASLPSFASSKGNEAASLAFACGAPAGVSPTLSWKPACATAGQPAATPAHLGNPRTPASSSGVTQTLCPTSRTAPDCLTESAPSSPDVKMAKTPSMPTMAGGASASTLHGWLGIATAAPSNLPGDGSFCATSSDSPDGTIPNSNWIALTTTGDTNPATCASSPVRLTWETADKSPCSNSASLILKPVFDIVNAGPRHRFTILTSGGPAVVSNCGFQMGGSKFVATAAIYGVTITEEFSQQVVDTYRTKFWRVKQLWYDQEEAAKRAVKSGRRIECGKTAWFVENGFLFCELPSGRRLAYAEPEIQPRTTSWGAIKETLTFMGIDGYSRQWKRQTTYGGSLVENIVQAIARDLLSEALWRCELSGTYLPVLTVHDEILAEAERGQGDIKEFEAMMAAVPEWADDMPIACEGFVCTRYRK